MRARLTHVSNLSFKRSRRPAYTLLEILLASAIGVLLMGGLYVAVDVQLRHAQAGREIVEQGTLVRALLARITSDINSSIGPVQPVVTSSSGGSGSGGAGGGGGATAGMSSGGASASGASGSGSGSGATGASSTPSTSSSSAPAGNAAQINSFQGNNDAFVVTVSKWPRELDLSPNASIDSAPTGVSDLRRITYWVAGGGGTPLGLARQEVKVVTSSDATLTPSIPPNVPDEASYVIAEEVKNLHFQYWDGTAWQDTWDSTQPGADGNTPQGPPLAIAITIDVALPGSTSNANGQESQPKVKSYRHVVPILTANGATQASTTTTTTSP